MTKEDKSGLTELRVLFNDEELKYQKMMECPSYTLTRVHAIARIVLIEKLSSYLNIYK